MSATTIATTVATTVAATTATTATTITITITVATTIQQVAQYKVIIIIDAGRYLVYLLTRAYKRRRERNRR